MLLVDWNRRWKTIFFLLISLNCIQSHMMHYYKIQKFLTAVAFARALGKRPRILPIPIPIPIPIAQNEVIKLPMGTAGKTMILDGSGGSKKTADISQFLGGGSFLPNSGTGYTGSTSYGYPLPGVAGDINPSELQGTDSNVINLASLLGSSNNAGPRIVVLGGTKDGNIMGGSADVVRLIRMPTSNQFQAVNGMNPGFRGNQEINDMNRGLNAANFGGYFGKLDTAYSMKSPGIFHLPQNLYSDRPRRKIPFKFRPRGMVVRNTNNFLSKSETEIHKDRSHPIRNSRPRQEQSSMSGNKGEMKPIPIGEKFAMRP